MKDTQYQFAAHIRDPEHNVKPSDVEDRRMKIYRELFFNNVEAFLARTFPVLKSVYSETQWQALAREFYSQHKCQTPYFNEIAQEFVLFLQHEHQADDDPAFMLELAHYEWMELALEIAEGEIEKTSHADWLTVVPQASPLLMVLQYQFPVHQISLEFQPTEAPSTPTFLAIYRNMDDEVKFMELNSVTARLLQFIQENEKQTGAELIQQLAEEVQTQDIEKFTQQALEHLDRFYEQDMIT
tara:strand:- start:21554 stop:22276 length:723 start_codon:yes stop_codon:yes gene_type:complete